MKDILEAIFLLLALISNSFSYGLEEDISSDISGDLPLRRGELIQQIESQNRIIIEYILRSGGGNIDGGGSNITYPTEIDLQSSLKIVLEAITTKEEGKNFVRRLRDQYPNQSLRSLYNDSVGSFRVTPIHRLKARRIESSNEAVLQMMIGDSFETLIDNYKACRFYHKGVENLYSQEALEIDLLNCETVSLNHYPRMLDFLKNTFFEFKEKCFDAFGQEKIGSVSEFTLKAKVCLSKSEFLKIPKNELLKTMFAVVLHEISHMFGTNEKQAKEFEIYIIHSYSSVFKSISGLVEDINKRRLELDLIFYRLNVYTGHTSNFIEGFIFRNFLFEKELLDILREEVISRDELLFLYPFEKVQAFDKAYNELKLYIETHFENQWGSFIIPRVDVFTEEEIFVLKGMRSVNSAVGESFTQKMNSFLMEIQNKLDRIRGILDNDQTQVGLTNRRDVMLYMDTFINEFDTMGGHDKINLLFFGVYEYFEQIKTK
ncbi:MAG: hypothetical protein K9K67_08960 [Bacteriovoracaceae bacterium]|nr:hypothetical protein [Bacteriovoracaceae bacterium]